MGAQNANCAVCGSRLEYFEEAQPVTCVVCGKKETGHSICVDGHYVCDGCHRRGGVDTIMSVCAHSDSAEPIAIAQRIMADASIYPNGPEHHSLVGAVLLSAYKNTGADIDLDSSLAELCNRSMQVPGGTCGFWGCCGAAISAGQFYAIISGSTPLTREPWAETARLTSRILGRIADIGGPRCCKRISFISIEEAVRYTAETTGIEMDLPERITCTFMAGNGECRKQDCPYFPTV